MIDSAHCLVDIVVLCYLLIDKSNLFVFLLLYFCYLCLTKYLEFCCDMGNLWMTIYIFGRVDMFGVDSIVRVSFGPTMCTRGKGDSLIKKRYSGSNFKLWRYTFSQIGVFGRGT